jgi:hypothetical protein
LPLTYERARKQVTLALGNNKLTLEEARAVNAAIDLREEAGIELPGTWNGLLALALGVFEDRGDEAR